MIDLEASDRNDDCGAGGGSEARHLVGDPVDVVTGAETHFETDFRLPDAPVRLSWVRHYDSRRAAVDRTIGPGFRLFCDVELGMDLDGLTFTDGRGVQIAFPFLGADGEEVQRDAHVLERVTGQRYRVHCPGGQPTFELDFGRDLLAAARPSAMLAPRHQQFGSQHAVRFHHDARGLASLDVGAQGRLTVERDGPRVRAVTLVPPQGKSERLVRYGYDGKGQLVEVENAYGHTTRYEYDVGGRISRKVDMRGYSFLFTYDSEGRCIRTRGEDGIADFRFEYRPFERLTIVTRGDGAVWRYFYDELGTIIQTIDPYGGLTAFLKDDVGRVVTEVDPLGNKSGILYDALGVPVARRDPLGHVRTLPTDPTPHPLDHFLPESPAEWEQGRQHLPPSGEVPAVHAATVDSLLPQWSLAAVGPTPEAALRSTSIVRDIQGLPLREERADGKTRRWGLDPNGYPRWLTDFDGTAVRYEHGSWNLLLRLEEPLKRLTEFQYTVGEQIQSVIDPGGTRTEFRYDLKDRLVEVRRHGRVRERYVYDPADNLVEKRDSDDRAILKLTIGPGNLVKRRELASGDVWDFRHDRRGRVVEGKNRAGACLFAYDDVEGRVIRDERDGAGVLHDLVGGQVATTTVLGRFTTEYLESEDGSRLVRDPADQIQRLRRVAPHLVQRTCSNGIRELAHYDLQGRCLLKVAEGPALAGDGWARRFGFSPGGNLVRRDDSARGVTVYEHDEARRLARVVMPDGSQHRYVYDRADNLLEAPGLTAGVRPGNQLAIANSDAFEYDQRDHVACRHGADGDTRYSYDSRDHLIAVDGPTLSYRAIHDVLGRRTSKTVNGEIWRYFWDDDRLAAEVWPDDRLRIYVYPDEAALVPLAFLDYDSVDADPASGRRYHLHTDHLGCPELVLDDAGQTVWRARVEPYGRVVVEVGAGFHQPLRWPGHYHDAETGLHENRFRSYSPELGRYLQSDPAGLAGGRNLYAYTDNPLRAVDLDGLGRSCPDDVPNCPNRKRGGPDQEAPPPKLPGVSKKERALAASSENSRAATRARKKVIKAFLKEHGQEYDRKTDSLKKPTAKQIKNQVRGHDLTKPVVVGPPPKCPSPQSQVQAPGRKQGSYYSDPGTKPTEVGVSPTARGPDGRYQSKETKDYAVKKKAPYLESTATPMQDTWSVKGQPVPTQGGGTQRVIPDRGMAKPTGN